MIVVFNCINDKVNKEQQMLIDYKSKEISMQPRFFVIGSDVTNVTDFYVVCEELNFKLPTFLKALDIALMLIYVFDLNFSPVSKVVWIFLANIFFTKAYPKDFNPSSDFNSFVKYLKSEES